MESELLDPTLDKLIIKWEGWGPPLDLNAEIQKESGEKIGKITSGGFIRKKAHLFDIDDGIILFTQKRGRRLGGGAKYKIKDSNENMIGTVKEKTSSSDTKLMIMENSQGVEILKGESDKFHNIDRTIVAKFNRIDRTIVAKFEIKYEEVEQSTWNDKIYNTCFLTINDLNYDRKTLFGFFVAYLTSHYDYKPRGEGGDDYGFFYVDDVG